MIWLEYILKSQSVFTSFYYTSAVKVKSVKSMAARLGLGIDLWRRQVLFSLRHRLWTNSVSQPLDNADSSTAETSPEIPYNAQFLNVWSRLLLRQRKKFTCTFTTCIISLLFCTYLISKNSQSVMHTLFTSTKSTANNVWKLNNVSSLILLKVHPLSRSISTSHKIHGFSMGEWNSENNKNEI